MYDKMTTDKILAELQQVDLNLDTLEEEGVKAGGEFVEGLELFFRDDAARVAFEAKLLQPVEGRNLGKLCWDSFWLDLDRDWSDEDCETRTWGGGGFHSLPTVEYMEGGTALFVTESQVEELKRSPWICVWERVSESGAHYLVPSLVDELIIIPDDEILR